MYPVTPVQFSVQEIINITDGQLVRGRLNQMVSRVSTDSRSLCVGDLFLALLGEHFDGHNFLSQAVFNGAMGVVVSRVDISLKKLDVSLVIRVPDTLQAYGNLAKAHREKFDGPVIAVTGSNGKTTTKEMINSVLSVKFRVFKSEKNYNNLIGLPKSLLELPVQKSEIAVFELGTNRPGEIARLTDIVRPTVGLITNIGFSHIKFLKDLDGVAKEKCSLLKNVSVAILNNNDTKLANIQTDLTTNRVNFGTDGDVVAENIHLNCNGLASFQLVINQLDRSIPIHLPCIGYHNVFNALAAATVGYWAGLTLEQIKTGLETFRTVQMRLQSININGFRIINDAYNANPDSVQSALELFSDLHANGEKIAVLGVTFKANTDDMRDSSSLKMIPHLIKKGAIVNYYDPTGIKKEFSKYKNVICSKDIKSAISKSDLIIIHTEWNDFKSINYKSLVKNKKFIIFDMRNIYSPLKMKQLNIKYYGVGR